MSLQTLRIFLEPIIISLADRRKFLRLERSRTVALIEGIRSLRRSINKAFLLLSVIRLAAFRKSKPFVATNCDAIPLERVDFRIVWARERGVYRRQ